MFVRKSALVLATALLVGAGPAPAQDLRFESGEHLYALWELLEGGAPLQPELFRRGWPTDEAHQRMTRELAADAAQRLLAGYLASGAGLPLSASTYEDLRFQRQARAGGAAPNPQALVRAELTAYKQLAGCAELSLPQGFDPVVVPVQRSRAELERSFSESELATWKWKAAASPRYALDGLGFSLIAQTRFAGIQLATRRDEDQAGRKVTLLGRTGAGGFWGLVALHGAIADLHELRAILIDARAEKPSPRASLAGLDEMVHMLPSVWTTTPGTAGPPAHALVDGESTKSYLFGLSAVLLGASELYALTDGSSGSKAPVLELFATATSPFEKDTPDVALDVALFAFRSLRSLHVDVIQQRATTLGGVKGGGKTINPADLGMFLLALRAFKDKVVLGGKGPKHPRAGELSEEQNKANVLISALGASFRGWEADSPGFFDLYHVQTNAKSAPTKSLAAQGLAVRGMLVAHRQVAQTPGERTPFLEAALRTVRWLDRERWDPAAQAWVEQVDGKASTKLTPMATMAVLGAMRDLALLTDDGRFLERYRQVLESLSARGLTRRGADRAGPGFAGEVLLEGGPK